MCALWGAPPHDRPRPTQCLHGGVYPRVPGRPPCVAPSKDEAAKAPVGPHRAFCRPCQRPMPQSWDPQPQLSLGHLHRARDAGQEASDPDQTPTGALGHSRHPQQPWHLHSTPGAQNHRAVGTRGQQGTPPPTQTTAPPGGVRAGQGWVRRPSPHIPRAVTPGTRPSPGGGNRSEFRYRNTDFWFSPLVHSVSSSLDPCSALGHRGARD